MYADHRGKMGPLMLICSFSFFPLIEGYNSRLAPWAARLDFPQFHTVENHISSVTGVPHTLNAAGTQ